MSIRIKILFALFLLFAAEEPARSQDAVKWVFTDYPPANFRTEKGDFSGFFYDIVMEVFQQRLGIRVDISVYPWKRCQRMVECGEADIMVTIPTPERKQYSVTHSRPIWIKRRILYTYREHPRIHEINLINGLASIKKGGYRVVSYLGNGWTEKDVQGIDIPVTFATTVDNMYRMLAAKRGDLIIEEKVLAAPHIVDLGLSKKIVETNGVGSESGFHILIGKKSAYASLIQALDREIEDMRKQGRLEEIFRSYLFSQSN
ncbi:transporter substrate-binding domain-containing protein [uncultured Desulfosarcina sp.]|uniref:substrate-binding periplasmic protein n=1 Tax=uncultured Desulfosarcina sp. TaxID=218289 RepID=UPI0029C98FB0|nr:transporter substrate-binding domain-containing protein [uncultured Desulfosarcina sp.]